MCSPTHCSLRPSRFGPMLHAVLSGHRLLSLPRFSGQRCHSLQTALAPTHVLQRCRGWIWVKCSEGSDENGKLLTRIMQGIDLSGQASPADVSLPDLRSF